MMVDKTIKLTQQQNIMVGQAVNLATQWVIHCFPSEELKTIGEDVLKAKIINKSLVFADAIMETKSQYLDKLEAIEKEIEEQNKDSIINAKKIAEDAYQRSKAEKEKKQLEEI